AAAALPVRHDYRRRRQVGLHRRRLDHCQGDPRPHDDGTARRTPALRLADKQGLRHARASRRADASRPLPAPPAQFRARAQHLVRCESWGLYAWESSRERNNTLIQNGLLTPGLHRITVHPFVDNRWGAWRELNWIG